MIPPFQDLRTLAENICMGESTIEKLVKQGQFPLPKKVGGKRLWEWKKVYRFLAVRDGDVAPLAPDEQAERIRDATRQAAHERH